MRQVDALGRDSSIAGRPEVNAFGRVDAFLNIHPGERRLVLLLFLQYFCTGTASVFIQTASFSLFLSRFDAAQLPYTYLMMAVILSVLTLGYLRAGKFLGFAGQLQLNLGAQILITVGFSAGLMLTDAPWVIFALPILFQIAVSFGNMAFWSLAGRTLNVGQGKRLFGLVGSGEWLAIVTMGFLMPFIVPLVGLQNLLWLAVLGSASALVTMTFTLRFYRHLVAEPPTAAAPREPVIAAKRSVAELFGNRYVLLLFALAIVWWVGFFFVDNLFYGQAARQYPDRDELAGFLGLYLGVLGVLTLFTNSFISGRVMGRFGIRSSLLILPVGLAIGAVVMALNVMVGGPIFLLFVAAVATRVWGIWIGFSIDQSARSVLYQPLPAALRTRVQTIADGVVQPLSTGLAGAALLLLGALFPSSSTPLIFGTLLLAAALLVLVLLIGRGYETTLLQALDKRRLTSTDLVVADATSVAILKRGLRLPQAGAVVYSMRMLGEADAAALAAELPGLLSHPQPDVRRYALQSFGTVKSRTAVTAVRQYLSKETSPDLRGVALRTLAGLGDLAPALRQVNAADSALRAGAILGLLQSGGADSAAVARGALTELTGSARAEDRLQAARILGEIESPTAVSGLQSLLQDADQRVRREALRASGRLGDAALWPQVVAGIADPTTRSAAIAGLVAGGEAALVAIGRALSAGAAGPSTLSLIDACGRIRSAKAIELLLPVAGSDNLAIRSGALRALSQCGYHAGRSDAARVHEWVGREALLAAWISAAMVDIGDDESSALLRTALSEQVRRCRDRVLILLSFVGDAAALRRAGDNLASGSASKLAYAIEVIDLETPVTLKILVLPLLEELPADRRLERLKSRFPQQHLDRHKRLAELGTNAKGRISAWSQACALHAAGLSDEPDFSDTFLPLLDSPNKLVREAAVWLQRRNDNDRGNQHMLSTIEKVIILRAASIFAETTDEVLAEVAAITTVSDAKAGEHLLEQGAAGDSMFVVASGRVRVHDGSHQLNELGIGEVFGEMALLDPEPRSASVTAIEDTQLLHLDQQALFELIDTRPEVARGLLQVLSRRLRGLIQDGHVLRDRQPPQLRP